MAAAQQGGGGRQAAGVKQVVSKADDKPGYLEQKAAGGNSRRFVCLCTVAKDTNKAAGVASRRFLFEDNQAYRPLC